MSLLTQSLTREVLIVLNREDAIFDVCCGPTGSGVSFDALLAFLQTLYPLSGWDATLLDSTLSTGQRRGIFKQFPLDVWYLNAGMALVNPVNIVFQPTSSRICGLPACKCAPSTIY